MGLLDDAIREHLDLKRRRGADPAEVERAEQEALGPVRRGPIEAEPPELVLDEQHKPEWDEYTDEHELPAAGQADGAASYPEPDMPLEPRAGVTPEPFNDEDDPFGDRGPTEPEPPRFSADPRSAGPDDLHEPAPARPREQYDDPASAGLGGHYDDPASAGLGEHSDDPASAGRGEHHDELEPTEVRLDEPAPPPHRAPTPRDQLGETVEYDVEQELGEGGGRTEEHARPAKKPPEGTGEEDPLEETPEFLQETPDHDRLWFEQRPPRDFDFDG